jgi:Tfp pilus assembly protein PilF
MVMRRSVSIRGISAAFMRRGTSYGAKADHGRAFGDLDKVIELDPKNVEDHLNRSALYGLKADRERALVEVNKAIEINPGFAGAYIARANIYLQLGNNEHAVPDAGKAIELDPKRANGCHIRKRCLFLYSRLRSLDLRQHRGDRDRSGIDGRLPIVAPPTSAKEIWNRPSRIT